MHNESRADNKAPATVEELAREAATYFEIAKRDDGTLYNRTKDDAPEWITDLVRAAHDDGQMLPDDWRYLRVRGALEHIAAAEYEYADESVEAFADSQVSTYNDELSEWLGSHSWRPGYVDQAQEDLIVVANTSIMERIMAGQQIEAREIFEQVSTFLRERLDG